METLLFIQSFKTPFLDKLFQYITMLGEENFFILIACWFIWCGDKIAGRRVGWIFLSGSILNGALKDIFHISRPIGNENIVSLRTETAGGYSFPSGHTQGTTMFWAGVMKIFRKPALYIAGSIIILLVALSRMYLGVHWPQDVIGGIVFGIIWVFIADYIWCRFEIAKSIYKIGIAVAIMVLCTFLFKEDHIVKSAGAATGFLIGIFLEDKYIKHISSDRIISTLIKMIFGLAVLFAIMAGVKMLLPDMVLFKGIRYAMIGFWITFGAPYVFKQASKLWIFKS
ncbi:MAG: phospholipid phosphatase [Spirochaetae bacterium HGW-Spirochaetae-5]|nr:MAG: phospholipid phosphatase [Spirochaetae bacterium HGW-Spirochaetae-5]